MIIEKGSMPTKSDPMGTTALKMGKIQEELNLLDERVGLSQSLSEKISERFSNVLKPQVSTSEKACEERVDSGVILADGIKRQCERVEYIIAILSDVLDRIEI